MPRRPLMLERIIQLCNTKHMALHGLMTLCLLLECVS